MTEKVCGHCGNPLDGFAGINGIRVCHGEIRNCYRDVTVYGHTLGHPKPRRLTNLTLRLERLVAAKPKQKDYVGVAEKRDIVELWGLYIEGAASTGFTPTLTEFAQWLLGGCSSPAKGPH